MRYSVHDGPGIRTTVFLKGCPLTCLWCHNPESQSAAPELMLCDSRCIGCGDCRTVCGHGAAVDMGQCEACGKCAAACPSGAREMAGRRVTVADVMNIIEKDIIFYDQSGGGVTFSGGEPLMQPSFLQSLLTACNKQSIHTAVDTSGFAATETLLCISKLTDLFLYDLKVMDEKRHTQYTGVSNRLILHNLKELSACGTPIRIRYPLIPGINDDKENVAALGAFAAALPGVTQIHILPYQQMGVQKYTRLRKEYSLPHTAPPGSGAVETVTQLLKDYGLTVITGG